MSGFNEKNGTLHADSVPLPTLAIQYGTPSYIYSASGIRARAAELQAAFRDTLPADRQPLIAFATKANSNVGILRVMGAQGLGADIVSGGELARAVRAGIPGSRIVFSGVGKTDDEIRAALSRDILQINVESKPELERIAAIAAESGRQARIALRVNPDVDAKTHAKITTGKYENKFGMPPGEAVALYEWAATNPHLQPRGFSVHIGSQLTSLPPYREAFTKLAALARDIRARGLTLEALDLGGGLGVIYDREKAPCLKTYAEIVRDTIEPLGTQIIVEPGRLMVAESGLLLTRVLYVKEGEGGRRYLILDGGMNDLMRPALYDAYHPIRPVTPRPGAPMHYYDIVGPVCETGDTFAKNRALPEMKSGDLVAIMVGGAYGFVMASQYNTRPLPAEILVDASRHAPLRPRESVDDILNRETMPEWLG